MLASRRPAPWLRLPAFTAAVGVAGAVAWASGCATPQTAALPRSRPASPVVYGTVTEETPAGGVRLVEHAEPLPAPAPVEKRPLPINLDTVLRLAEDGNAQVALARERLHESQLEQEVADKGWIPQMWAGAGYYRHEGGIQNEDGTLQHSSTGALFPNVEIRTAVDLRQATFARVDAERKEIQARGEVSRITNETLLEAVNTYYDLLAARRGQTIAAELEAKQVKLLERNEKLLTPEDQSARVLVEGLRTELSGRRQALARLRQQGDAAAAKLAYLLNLGCDVQLEPVDPAPEPIDLVDATAPTGALVQRALTVGPGVQELQQLLAVIGEGLARLDSPLAYLPTVQLNLCEGAFLAGKGGTLDSDNRFDACLQLRWNLTEFCTAREKRAIGQSKYQQAALNLADLQGRLTAGVQEAQEAILSGRDQIRDGSEMIRHAAEAYRLANLRLTESAPGSSTGEVQSALRGLEQAQLNYLNAVTAYNKAEVRLLLLLGRGAVEPGPGCRH